MAKKGLIMYQTQTGNTEKVVLRFKEVFEKKGWQCDIFKVEKKTDVNKPPAFQEYDFLCVGSGVYYSLPPKQILDIMFRVTHDRSKPELHRKIIPGPKTGIVFATYGGAHLGPKEAEPALSLLALNMEHLKFICVGRFSCPGKEGKRPTPDYWHGDLSHRPSERDLKKAEIFLEETLEAI